MDEIMNSFYEKMKNINLDAYGILDAEGKIHTLGTDSKIIGRIFEMFTQPVLSEIADENGYILETPEKQNIYPDFIMLNGKESKGKIAIDVKTTYIDNHHPLIKYTMGSFGSYMRNNTKNIAYPYTDFVKHYVIGFVYRRNDSAQESDVYDYHFRDMISFPYQDVKYFIQEKYKIAGEKPGSGNTENIGSFETNSLEELRLGNGPFSVLGHDVYDLYWENYPRYKEKVIKYKTIKEFGQWLRSNRNNLNNINSIDVSKVISKVNDYLKGF